MVRQRYRDLFAGFLPVFRAVFFADLLAPFLGTFAPFFLASDKPMAIACLRLVTFLPLLPVLSVPDFFLRMALFTFLPAPFEYFAIVVLIEQYGSKIFVPHRLRFGTRARSTDF